MIVVMAYVPQKDRLRLGLESRIFEWHRRRRGPPRIKMRTRTASQSRTPPPAIHAVRSFVMQTADVNGHPLQDECGAFSDRLISPLGELIEELLMAVDGTGRTRGPKVLLEKNGVAQRVILARRRCAMHRVPVK